MSAVSIESVSTGRQRKAFLTYPWRLYRGDPNWIPPLRHDQEETVGYRPHPFYEQNQAQTFLAYRDGEVCGQDFYAYTATLEMLPAASSKLFPVADQVKERFDVHTRPIDKSHFRKDVEGFMRVYNESMAGQWEFLPMSPAEIQHSAKSLRHLMVPEMACVIEVDDKMVGAAFSIPDYNPRIKQIDGRLFPFGFLRLLWNKRSIKKVRNIASNVSPEYQLMGLLLVLAKEMFLRGTTGGVEEIEFSWVAESNLRSRGSLEKAGARREKTYRVYDWDPA